MADSFFGFDTSLSNLNDDEIAGEPSEDEYDALNDETFGQDSQEFDWEVEHEQLAEQLESSRRHHSLDDVNMQLEASLSQLVLDEPDSTLRTLGSSVWRHDPPMPTAPTPVQLKNVCTVEEVERQLRQKQQTANNQAFFQPRFAPVILQRPPGLQAPVPLPFAPQQQISTNMRDMNQQASKLLTQNHNQITHMGQNSILQNHVGQNINPMGQNINQMGQNVNQMGQNINQMGQNMNQIGQNINQMGQNMNQLGQNVNQFMQTANQMNQFQNNQNNLMGVSQSLQTQLLQNPIGQNMTQLGQNALNQIPPNQLNQNQISQGLQMGQIGQNTSGHMSQNLQQNMTQMKHNSMGQGQMCQISQNLNHSINQLGPNMNHMGQNVNQMNQNISHMGQQTINHSKNVNHMGQTMNQMGPNVNQQNVNQMQSINQMGQNNVNPMTQNVNQMGQHVNQISQNVNQIGQGVNQILPNGNQFGPGMNPLSHMMGQPLMMGPPPPGMNMPRQNFTSNVGPFNQNFRGPAMPTKPAETMTQMSQPLLHQQFQHQLKNQPANMKVNQSQNKPVNKSQIVQPKVEPKTKTRVFNSTKLQSNMTSQNLVQLIQNTHPMLHMNSGYHNASHHPMLNNRTMFNTQFVTSQLFNQRHNGTFNNGRVTMNGDDSLEGDEYAGLMTPREKQWLINIQMLQLNTGTPYIHDFYYTVFLERQKEKESVKEAHKANQQNHPFYSGAVKQESHTHTRERHNSNRHNSTSEDATPRTYVPAQFENSLGKLQCGSVTAPRKIIDADVVSTDTRPPSRAASRASTANPAEIPRELKRTKQLLLDIEALYLILLRLEELNDPLAISNALILKEREEKQKLLEAAQKELEEQEDEPNLFLKNIESVQRRKQDSPKSETIDKRQVVNLAVCQKPPVKNLLDENKEELVGKMFSGLLYGDRLPQILTVRKGRLLLSRFLRRVPASHVRMRTLWARLLRAVPSSRRALPHLSSLAPFYARYIQGTTGWSAVLESCSMLVEAFDPARTPYALTSSFTLSCVCALVERASSLVSPVDATSNERQWSKFLKSLARALKNTTLIVAKPVHPLSETKLLQHLKILESRATIEILQRGKTASEFADVSKTDVQEQLVKHLC